MQIAAEIDIKSIEERIKSKRRAANSWLIHYRERARDHAERRREIESGKKSVDENVGGGRSSMPGNPTQAIVMALAVHDDCNSARWIRAVEDVMRIVGPKKRQLIELRQECRFYIGPDGGRPGWIAPVQQRFGEITGWCPAEQTLKTLWADVVNLMILVAAERNCKF